MTEVVEAEVVETEVAVAPTGNLFRGSTPAEVLKQAQATAEAFKPVLAANSVNVQGKAHVTVEGWQTLGAMLGVTSVCEWTRQVENGWEARVEARTLDGRVIGAAEAECLRDEKRWAKADDYAVRSMAQTRATSKALASVLRFVATLAGASGTPAEEMPREQKSWDISPKQMQFLERLLKEKGDLTEDQLLLIREWASTVLKGGKAGSASEAIDGLMNDPEVTIPRLLAAAEKWQAARSDMPADTTDLPEAA